MLLADDGRKLRAQFLGRLGLTGQRASPQFSGDGRVMRCLPTQTPTVAQSEIGRLAPALLRAKAQGSLRLLQPPHFVAEVAAVLARLKGDSALQDIDNLSALDIAWAQPAPAVRHAAQLALDLNHHVFDMLYHTLALDTPGATLVTADRRHFDKCRHLGQITWLPDWRLG